MGGLGPRIFDAWMSQVHQFRMVCAKTPGNPLLVPPPKKKPVVFQAFRGGAGHFKGCHFSSLMGTVDTLPWCLCAV